MVKSVAFLFVWNKAPMSCARLLLVRYQNDSSRSSVTFCQSRITSSQRTHARLATRRSSVSGGIRLEISVTDGGVRRSSVVQKLIKMLDTGPDQSAREPSTYHSFIENECSSSWSMVDDDGSLLSYVPFCVLFVVAVLSLGSVWVCLKFALDVSKSIRSYAACACMRSRMYVLPQLIENLPVVCKWMDL